MRMKICILVNKTQLCLVQSGVAACSIRVAAVFKANVLYSCRTVATQLFCVSQHYRVDVFASSKAGAVTSNFIVVVFCSKLIHLE